MKRHRKKLETSKLLLAYAIIMNTAMIVYGCILAWKLLDASIIVTIIGGTMAEVATCFGFYFWKSKAENVVKLAKANGIPLTESTVSTIGTITGG